MLELVGKDDAVVLEDDLLVDFDVDLLEVTEVLEEEL